MLRLGLLPQGEVGLVTLFSHAVKLAAGILHVVKVAAGEYAVTVVFVVFRRVEVYASVALVGIAVVKDLLHQLLLLYDVAGGVRLDAGRQHVEGGHRVVVAVGVILRYLHRFELFEARFLGYLVLALVGVVLKMAYVGDIADVSYLVAEMFQVAE